MYGLLRGDPRSREGATVKHHFLCNVCNTLAKTYGNKYRFFASYDASFLSLLSAGQMSHYPRNTGQGCRFWGMPRSSPRSEIRYASSIAFLTGQAKMLDKYYETGSHSADIVLRLMNRTSQKAKKVLMELNFPPTLIQDQIRRQHQLEQQPGVTLTELCEPTETVVSQLFEHTAILADEPQNRAPLYQIGRNVGALMYVLDSLADLRKDMKTQEFNPFLACGSLTTFLPRRPLAQIRQLSHDFIQQRLNYIQEHIQYLRFKNYGNAVVTTLTRDLKTRVTQILDSVRHREDPIVSFLTLPPKRVLIPSLALLIIPMILQSGDGDCTDCCCEESGSSSCGSTDCSGSSSPTDTDVLIHVVEGGTGGIIGGGSAAAVNRLRKPPKPTPPARAPAPPLQTRSPPPPPELHADKWILPTPPPSTQPPSTPPPSTRTPRRGHDFIGSPPPNYHPVYDPRMHQPRDQLIDWIKNKLDEKWRDQPKIIHDTWKFLTAPRGDGTVFEKWYQNYQDSQTESRVTPQSPPSDISADAQSMKATLKEGAIFHDPTPTLSTKELKFYRGV